MLNNLLVSLRTIIMSVLGTIVVYSCSDKENANGVQVFIVTEGNKPAVVVNVSGFRMEGECSNKILDAVIWKNCGCDDTKAQYKCVFERSQREEKSTSIEEQILDKFNCLRYVLSHEAFKMYSKLDQGNKPKLIVVAYGLGAYFAQVIFSLLFAQSIPNFGEVEFNFFNGIVRGVDPVEGFSLYKKIMQQEESFILRDNARFVNNEFCRVVDSVENVGVNIFYSRAKDPYNFINSGALLKSKKNHSDSFLSSGFDVNKNSLLRKELENAEIRSLLKESDGFLSTACQGCFCDRKPKFLVFQLGEHEHNDASGLENYINSYNKIFPSIQELGFATKFLTGESFTKLESILRCGYKSTNCMLNELDKTRDSIFKKKDKIREKIPECKRIYNNAMNERELMEQKAMGLEQKLISSYNHIMNAGMKVALQFRQEIDVNQFLAPLKAERNKLWEERDGLFKKRDKRDVEYPQYKIDQQIAQINQKFNNLDTFEKSVKEYSSTIQEYNNIKYKLLHLPEKLKKLKQDIINADLESSRDLSEVENEIRSINEDLDRLGKKKIEEKQLLSHFFEKIKFNKADPYARLTYCLERQPWLKYHVDSVQQSVCNLGSFFTKLDDRLEKNFAEILSIYEKYFNNELDIFTLRLKMNNELSNEKIVEEIREYKNKSIIEMYELYVNTINIVKKQYIEYWIKWNKSLENDIMEYLHTKLDNFSTLLKNLRSSNGKENKSLLMITNGEQSETKSTK